MIRFSKIFLSVISATLSIILITLVVCACVPQTRDKMADWATKYSPEHQQLVEENKRLQQLIHEKDELIASQLVTIKENNDDISSLNNDKQLALSALSDIDNQINSATDPVDIASLETRKQAILMQITTLNNSIDAMEQDVADLQESVYTLTAEKQSLQQDLDSSNSKINILEARMTEISQALSTAESVNMVHEGVYLTNDLSKTLTRQPTRTIPVFESSITSAEYYDNTITASAAYKYGTLLSKTQITTIVKHYDKLYANKISFLAVTNSSTTSSLELVQSYSSDAISLTFMFNGETLNSSSISSVLTAKKYYATVTSLDLDNHTAVVNLWLYDSTFDLNTNAIYKSTTTDTYFDFGASKYYASGTTEGVAFTFNYTSGDSTLSTSMGTLNILSNNSFEFNGETFSQVDNLPFKQTPDVVFNFENGAELKASDLNGDLFTVTDGVDYTWYFSDANETNLGQTIPTTAGNYSLTVVTTENDSFLSVTKFVRFVFDTSKEIPEVTFSIETGTELTPEELAAVVITVPEGVEYTWCYQNANEEDIGQTIPTTSGRYVISVTTIENDTYSSTVAWVSFTLEV